MKRSMVIISSLYSFLGFPVLATEQPTPVIPTTNIHQLAQDAGCEPELYALVQLIPSGTELGPQIIQLLNEGTYSSSTKSILPDTSTLAANPSTVNPTTVNPTTVNPTTATPSASLAISTGSRSTATPAPTPEVLLPTTPASPHSPALRKVLVLLAENGQYTLSGDLSIQLPATHLGICSLGRLVVEPNEVATSGQRMDPDSCTDACFYGLSVLSDSRAVVTVQSESVRDQFNLSNRAGLYLGNIAINGEDFTSDGALINVTQGSLLELNFTQLSRASVITEKPNDNGRDIKSVIYATPNAPSDPEDSSAEEGSAEEGSAEEGSAEGGNVQPSINLNDYANTVSLDNYSSVIHNMPGGTGIRAGGVAEILLRGASQSINYQGKGILLDCATLEADRALIANLQGAGIFAVHNPEQTTGADIFIRDSSLVTASGNTIQASHSRIYATNNRFFGCPDTGDAGGETLPNLQFIQKIDDICRQDNGDGDTVFFKSPQEYHWYSGADEGWQTRNGPGLNQLCLSNNLFFGVTQTGLDLGEDSFQSCPVNNNGNSWWASGIACQGIIEGGTGFNFENGITCGKVVSTTGTSTTATSTTGTSTTMISSGASSQEEPKATMANPTPENNRNSSRHETLHQNSAALAIDTNMAIFLSLAAAGIFLNR